MANKKYDKEEGVWRTIGGRRVFIKTGQSLSDAMRESGKFVKRKGVTIDEYRKAENNLAQKKSEYNVVKERGKEINEEARYHSEKGVNIQEYEDALREAQQKYDDLMKKDGYMERQYGVNQQELNNLKHPKGLKTYDSVEDRYNKDKDFRSMLKKIDDDYNDDKLMSRDEYESYASRIPNREDYAATSYEDYIEATKNTGSIKEVNDSIKTYDGYMGEKEGLEEYNKVDKEWQDLSKKMEKDYDEYGGNTVEDMKRLNELSRKRDYLSIYNYNEENKKLFDKYDKEEISHKEYNEKSDKLKEKYLSTHEEFNRDNTYWNGKGKYRNYVDTIDGLSDEQLQERGISKGLINQYRDEAHRYYRYFNDGDMPHQKTLNGKTYSRYYKNIPYGSDERKYWEDTYASDMENRINSILGKMQDSEMKTLTTRYKGTINYLQQSTNMTIPEIYELLKKIEKDKR